MVVGGCARIGYRRRPSGRKPRASNLLTALGAGRGVLTDWSFDARERPSPRVEALFIRGCGDGGALRLASNGWQWLRHRVPGGTRLTGESDV